MIWVIRVMGFIASALASVFIFQLGTQLSIRLLGKNKCLPHETLVGCDWWIYSTLFSTAVVIGASHLGWIALAFVPIVPIVFVVIATLRLRFGEMKARKMDFEVAGNQVLDVRTKREIKPSFVESRSAYYQTGVGSGYCLYNITIRLRDGTSLDNGYISEEEKTKDYEALVSRVGSLAFDLTVVDQPAETRFRTVTLGQEWATVLCGSLSSLSAEAKTWWTQWNQPKFGLLGSQSLKTQEVLRMLNELEDAYRDEIQRSERMSQDCKGLKRLLSTASGDVTFCTTKAHFQAQEGVRKQGVVMYKSDEGVMEAEVTPRS